MFVERAETKGVSIGSAWLKIEAFENHKLVQTDSKIELWGFENEAQMTPKWGLGAPKSRIRKIKPKKLSKGRLGHDKGRLGHDFGVAFWSHF